MITNADITLYNHYYDKDTRLDKWHRTVIYGVHFYVDHKVSVGDNGLNSADVYKIRIPEDSDYQGAYVSEDEWIALGQNVSGKWTLQSDDIVVLGESDLDIERPAQLKEAGKRYCKVTSWSDNRFGGLPHWRIGGE